MHHRITRLEREIEEIQSENSVIKNDVEQVKKDLINKTPEHFSGKDILRSFIGSLFLGFSVVFSTNLLNLAKIMPAQHIYFILAFIFILLTVEIYFVGYRRVDDKEHRHFGQFWIKRLIAFYAVALLVAFILVYIFGLVYLINSNVELLKVVIIMSGPCAVGASLTDLMKKY